MGSLPILLSILRVKDAEGCLGSWETGMAPWTPGAPHPIPPEGGGQGGCWKMAKGQHLVNPRTGEQREWKPGMPESSRHQEPKRRCPGGVGGAGLESGPVFPLTSAPLPRWPGPAGRGPDSTGSGLVTHTSGAFSRLRLHSPTEPSRLLPVAALTALWHRHTKPNKDPIHQSQGKQRCCARGAG